MTDQPAPPPDEQADIIQIDGLSEDHIDEIIAHQQDDPDGFAALWESRIVRHA